MNKAQRKVVGRWAVAGVFLFVTSCGFKSPPLPPETVVPEPILDLRYFVDDGGAHLSWSYPLRTIAGEKLSTIDTFDLYRAEVSLDDLCENCPLPFSPPLSLPGGEVYNGEDRQTGHYDLDNLRSGYKYFFSLRSRTSWWAASADSNIISFVWFTPVAAVEGLRIEEGDGSVSLSWQEASLLQDGSEAPYPVWYQVQRAVKGGSYSSIGSPIEESSYQDDRVEKGQEYSYRVQSLLEYKGDFLQGESSVAIVAHSVDLTPPPPPSGVTAVQVAGGVRILWRGVTVADRAGYRIYRRGEDSDAWQLLVDLSGDRLSYTDKGGSGKAFYRVTAYDNASPANESSPSLEVSPRYGK